MKGKTLFILAAAIIIAAVLSSCGDLTADNSFYVRPSGPDSTINANPSPFASDEQVTQSESPEEPVIPAASEPRFVLNPEDPLAGNTHPEVKIDYLSQRQITPIKADVLTDMPAQTFTSYREGWALEEVLPVGFHMYLEYNGTGNLLFDPGGVFPMCEVRPGGSAEEEYAFFDGYGSQITNDLFDSPGGSSIRWLPSSCGSRDGTIYYIDKDSNIFSPMSRDYLGTDGDGWETYHISDNSAYYCVFITPTGKEITYKTVGINYFESFCIMPDDILVIATPEFTIAYDREGKPVWKLEYRPNEFYPKHIFGQRRIQLLEMCNSQGKLALYDSKGTQLTEFIYDDAWSVGGEKYAVVAIGEKYGLLDLSGHQVLPCAYDSFSYDTNSNAGMIVHKDGKYGLMADPSSGEWTVPCEYEDIQFIYGTNELLVKENGAYYIWKDGIRGDAAFDNPIRRIDSFDEEIYVMGIEDMGSRLVRADGTTILDNISLERSCEDGSYLFFDYITKLYGYLNSAAEVIIKPQYELAGAFRKGFAIVKKDGYIKLIDKNNQVIMDTVFNDVVCWNPDTMVLAVNYTPGGTKLDPRDHFSAPDSRCGLVKLILPDAKHLQE